MEPEEREHWTRLMLQRSMQGEPLVRPIFCRLLSIYAPNALAKRIASGEIPTIRVGRADYIVESVIADFIVSQNLRRFHSSRIAPIQTNHDPSRGHPMDDMPDQKDDQESDP